jgi:cytochrome c oxidase subunit 3/cytochrome o ubiquinol oxidase subunit 3
MYCLMAAEAAMFTIFVVAYLFYAGKSLGGPFPKDVLHVPILFTICLLSSSATIHLAVRSWTRGYMTSFGAWWLATIALGALFLAGTALEWRRLIYDQGLTIQTNLFGTTYYALVGLHALHVTVGLICLAVVSALALAGHLRREHAPSGDVLSLYWHFVDGVWVVVFTVVYVVGR